MARLDIADILNWPFLLALGGAQFATFALALVVAAFLFQGRLGALLLHGLSAVSANTGYMGDSPAADRFQQAGRAGRRSWPRVVDPGSPDPRGGRELLRHFGGGPRTPLCAVRYRAVPGRAVDDDRGGEIGWLVPLKLLVQPALTYVLALEVLRMERLWAVSAAVLAALPAGALVFVLAQQYDSFTQRSASAILASTMLSMLTMSALFWLIGPL
jgi:hypothetical protein